MTAPGWYPDARDPHSLRWWNGTEWVDHVGPPVAAGPANRRPMLPKDASVVNPYIWIIACLPFLPGVLMLTWHLEVRTYTRNGTLTLDPATIFSTGYFLIWGGLVFTYCSTVVLARFDTRRLVQSDVVRPFHWAWSFLGGIPYVIGRIVVTHKVAPRRGLWPLVVIFSAWGLYYVAGTIKSLAFMRAAFDQLGYPA